VRAKAAWAASAALLVALILLLTAWELVLAPLRPGGSWLVLKVVPLMAPLFGVLHARRYTFQWSTLLIWLYFTEGVVRAWSDPRPASLYAGAEIALSLAYFACAVSFVRLTRRD
jgi:uncharacterized membrane protein